MKQLRAEIVKEAKRERLTQGVTDAKTRLVPGQPLSLRQICEVQELLADWGYYNSTVDGIPGPGTTRAIAEFAEDKSLPNTALTSDLLLSLRAIGNPPNQQRAVSGLPANGEILLAANSDRAAPLEVITREKRFILSLSYRTT